MMAFHLHRTLGSNTLRGQIQKWEENSHASSMTISQVTVAFFSGGGGDLDAGFNDRF